MSPRPVGTVLLVLLLPIGDTLFATPAIHAARARYPGANFVALTYPTNRGILQANPDVDAIWLAPTRQHHTGIGGALDLVRRLRAARFDLVLAFSNVNFGLRYWSRAGGESSMHLPHLWWLVPGAGRAWRRRHAVEHYADVVRRRGIPVPDWHLRVSATAEEIAAGDRLLASHGVQPGAPLIGIHPGGEGLWGRKRWSPRRFAAVADALHAQFGVKIVVLGGGEDAPLAAQVARYSTAPVLNLAGQTTLGATAALAARCVAFIGNDSSPLHLAVAAGTRVVGIYGVTDPRSYRPWLPGGRAGRDYAVVLSPARCAACFPLIGGISLWEWPRALRCDALSAIRPAAVIAAAVPLVRAAIAAAGAAGS